MSPTAVVSKVHLSQWCLSVNNRTAFCSAGGDQLNFNLTLNGDPLQVTPGRPGSQSVMLSGQRTGELVCVVWNDFSQQEKRLRVTDACQQYSGSPTALLLFTPPYPQSSYPVESDCSSFFQAPLWLWLQRSPESSLSFL